MYAARTGLDPVARTFATGVGERDSLRLADGTLVILGPGSRLQTDADFGNDRRQLALTGEAFFDVADAASMPFIVRAEGTIIEDLGTAFAVHAHPDYEVRVVVTDGSVAVRDPGAPDAGAIVLNEGDRAAVSPDGVVLERGVVSEADLAWTRGQLTFDDAPLHEVSFDLRRWYGLEVIADSSFAERRLTVSFLGESREQVVEVIRLALGASVTLRGDTAIFVPAAQPPLP
jgi:transmembrane sensor